MLNILGLVFLGAVLAPWVHKFCKDKTVWVVSLIPLAVFLYFLRFLSPENANSIITETIPWAQSLGIQLSFYLDGLSLLFSLIISGIGFLIFVYAGAYCKGYPTLGRLYCYLFIFMGAMLGVVLSYNLISLFLFWELTSVSSFLLIGFNNEKLSSRKSAVRALFITGAGGICLLGGFLLLGQIGGSFQIGSLMASKEVIFESGFYIPILALVLLGAFTKSAQFPYHFWLPGAMEAPTPISAYLHSATMVKAGVYLLLRFHYLMGGTAIWQWTLIGFGVTTLFIGAFLSFQKTDLKQILAYSTVSVLGLLVFQIGVGSKHSIKACLTFLLAHALSKAALFMVAGAVDHEAGTRDIKKLHNLRKTMPVITVAVILAAFSKIGMPPFFGFLGKELTYAASLEMVPGGAILLGITVVSKILLVVSILTVAFLPFFRKEPLEKGAEMPKHPHRAPFGLWFGPLTLGILGMAFGVYPKLLDGLMAFSVSGVTGKTFSFYYKLWHGFNLVLVMSIITLVVGYICYLFREKIVAVASKVPLFEFAKVYDWKIESLYWTAKKVSHTFQNGNMRSYLLMTFITVLALFYLPISQFIPSLEFSFSLEDAAFLPLFTMLMIAAAGIYLMVCNKFIPAIMALGIVGFGMALLFTFFGAPDLALTQLVIETLSVILFLAVLHFLPEMKFFNPLRNKVADLLISLSFGVTIVVFMLVVLNEKLPKSLTHFFAEKSYIVAHGKNVVNVIIVDFRALDTMGEITVLAIAAVGILALLKIKPKKDEVKKT